MLFVCLFDWSLLDMMTRWVCFYRLLFHLDWRWKYTESFVFLLTTDSILGAFGLVHPVLALLCSQGWNLCENLPFFVNLFGIYVVVKFFWFFKEVLILCSLVSNQDSWSFASGAVSWLCAVSVDQIAFLGVGRIRLRLELRKLSWRFTNFIFLASYGVSIVFKNRLLLWELNRRVEPVILSILSSSCPLAWLKNYIV